MFSGAQCGWPAFRVYSARAKISLHQDKENQIALQASPSVEGVWAMLRLWGWRIHTGWGRGCRKGETRGAAWWLWEMNTLPTPSPEWSPARGTLCFTWCFQGSQIICKNGVYFDKNLGRMGSVLNLLEGREVNHGFYKNVFTRELEKCKHMLGGRRSVPWIDIEERNT